jgi:hypothetical protein
MADTGNHCEIQLDLPRELFEAERGLASPDYVQGEARPLPPDAASMEARFVEPVTLIAPLTLAMLAQRLLHFALARRGQGVMVDARTKPPHVSALAGVPQGFVVIIHPDGKTETVRADNPPEGFGELLGKAVKPGA